MELRIQEVGLFNAHGSFQDVCLWIKDLKERKNICIFNLASPYFTSTEMRYLKYRNLYRRCRSKLQYIFNTLVSNIPTPCICTKGAKLPWGHNNKFSSWSLSYVFFSSSFFVFLPFCLFVCFCLSFFVFLSRHHADQMSERSEVQKSLFVSKFLSGTWSVTDPLTKVRYKAAS